MLAYKRRRLTVGLIVLAFAAVTVVACVFLNSASTPAKVEQIKKGMARAEVDAILGPPTTVTWVPDAPDDPPIYWWTIAEWEFSNGYVFVVFYENQVDQHMSEFQPPLWKRFARRIGLGP